MSACEPSCAKAARPETSQGPGETPPHNRLDQHGDAPEQQQQQQQTHTAAGKTVMAGLLLGYVGTGMSGLQLQADLPLALTVEGRLFLALFKAGVIETDPAGIKPLALLQKLCYNRGSRTDKGVHAARNLVVLRLGTHVVDDAEASIRRVNAALGEDVSVVDPKGATVTVRGGSIRVFAVTRVKHDFIPRTWCTRRMYRYLIPAFAADASCDAFTHSVGPSKGVLHYPWFAAGAAEQPTAVADDAAQAYFCSAADRLNDALGKFEGMHRFHNFTEDPSGGKQRFTKVKAWDNESLREIFVSRVLPSPVWLPSSSSSSDAAVPLRPYLVFQVHGGSFLLHMIRKLVGMAIAAARGCRATLVDDALDPEKMVATPMAPAEYLSLHRQYFDFYDQSNGVGGPTTTAPYPALCEAITACDAETTAFEVRRIYREVASVDGPDAAAVVAPMTAFVRVLRMHNWLVKENPFGPSKKRGAKAPVTLAAAPSTDAEAGVPGEAGGPRNARGLASVPGGMALGVLDAEGIAAINALVAGGNVVAAE